MKLPVRLCVAAILAGKKPAPLPVSAASAAVSTAPPPPKKEATPSAREGVVWSHGYWKHTDNWFVWCAGHWELSRPGMRYESPRWERHADGWHLAAGCWHADEGSTQAQRKSPAAPHYDALGAFR